MTKIFVDIARKYWAIGARTVGLMLSMIGIYSVSFLATRETDVSPRIKAMHEFTYEV